MAGLFFWHKNEQYDFDEVNKTFGELDYNNGKYIKMGNWNTLVFPKKNYDIQNWHYSLNGAICCIGTFAYKGRVYEKALPFVYDDFENGRLNSNFFWGSFIILLYKNDRMVLIRDGANLTRLYKYKNEVYSTSFAAMVKCLNRPLNFDFNSATELFTTGMLAGSSTLIQEISCVNSGQKLDGIELVESASEKYIVPKSREEALGQQIEIAQSFFKNFTHDWTEYKGDSVFDVGMTGGMDSRLLACLLYKHTNKVVTHTHWRSERAKNKDYKYAHIFAKETNTPIHTKKVSSPLDMGEEELKDNFYQAYCLSDGEIRPGCYWDEAFSTATYRSALTNPPFLRLLGFGGEQYRNRERIPLYTNQSFRNFINWEIIYQFAGNKFTSLVAKNQLIDKIENQLVSRLGLNNTGLYTYKNYVRFVQSPSYRSIQAHLENKLGFCINPFLDTQLSGPSVLAIPFLGKGLDFQLEMMSKINPKLSRIPNGYGFDFSKGEPARLKIASSLWQALPRYIKFPIYTRLHNGFKSDFISIFSQRSLFVKNLLMEVEELHLPLDINKFCLVRSRGQLILNLGYFIMRNKDLVKF